MAERVDQSARRLSFLLDTNVFIAAEPANAEDIEAGSEPTAALLRQMYEGGHALFVHPAAEDDLGRQDDSGRRRLRRVQFSKYPLLPSPPRIPPEWQDEFGQPEGGGNHHIDLLHLAAVAAHAVTYLLTEDRGLHGKAERVGLGSRVITVDDGLTLLRGLYVTSPSPPPTVQRVFAHELDAQDPIFDSLKADYHGFVQWFDKAREERRLAFVVRGPNRSLAAVSLVKDESDGNDADLSGRALKISTFKVSSAYAGNRYGELLLKALFLEAKAAGYDGVYTTAYAGRQPALVSMLAEFGFTESGRLTELGEQIFAKPLATPLGLTGRVESNPLNYHIRFGPPALHPEAGRLLVVPIQPRFTRRLFPDAEEQLELFGPPGYGNAIRKAYLCHAQIRLLAPGDVLLFYRSGDRPSVVVVGVVEQAFVSTVPEDIAGAVGTRTVYAMDEIEQMSEEGDVLAILFRQDRVLDEPITVEELQARGTLTAPPQSITEARQEGYEWLRQRIQR